MISLRSAITKKLLNYFFINPKEELYINEISKLLGLDKRNLVKKIRELETEGILTVKPKGNLKLYSINEKYHLYKEYKVIFLKTLGLEDKLKNILNKINGIKTALLFGSYVKNTMDTNSDIDLLVVGEHSILELQKQISIVQKQINREINTVNISSTEYDGRIKKNDPFITGIMKGDHIKLQ
ncbi:MAG: hypothetical protein A2252_01080 [Elusimicrobia bacterium RIFOXYA2_FULL_39_19]|nr:MAG: hypothetical protein A2252_01080 [Elusimicrobia bacterium RIFOXYA2_FULL_39_19]